MTEAIVTEATILLDFGGSLVRAVADTQSWIDRLRQAFSTFVCDARAAKPDFELMFRETTAPAWARDLPLTWEGRLPDGFMGRIYEAEGSAVLEVDDGGIVVIDHQKRNAVAEFRPGSHASFFGSAVMLVVESALAAKGQYMIHAACLIEKRSGRAALFCVPSGGGKTTTAMTLAHDGFSLMTDDASVLVHGSARPQVWGFPRALKVHRRTAELLPWLGTLPDRWDEDGEQGVTLDSLAGRIDVAGLEPVELAAIFQLGPRSAGGHSISVQPKAEMLFAIAHDNVAWRPAGMVPKAVRRFDAFAQAVAQVPTFNISAGTDLATLPALVAAAMNRAAQPAESLLENVR